MSKEKEKRERNIQDKRKEKLERKEIHACEKRAKRNEHEGKKGKRGCSSRSGDFSDAQNRFGMKKNCLGKVGAW
jgi:hypothetical protein